MADKCRESFRQARGAANGVPFRLGHACVFVYMANLMKLKLILVIMAAAVAIEYKNQQKGSDAVGLATGATRHGGCNTGP